MEVLQDDNGTKGKFYITNEKQQLAEMAYVWAGNDRIIIEHTEVSDSLRGMGAGKELLLRAVDFARQKGISIIPLCRFAKSVFDKEPDIRDVL